MTREEALEFGNMWLEVNEDCKDSNTYEFFQIAVELLKGKSCDNCAYYDNGANDEACNGCFEDKEHLNFKPKEKTGYWIERPNAYECSKCGIIRAKGTTGKYNYCPNCGIRTIGTQKSEEV